MRKKRLRDRLQLIFGAVLFLCLFNYVYIMIVTKKWAYYGFTFESPTIQNILIMLLLGLLPIVWMPTRLTRPSQVLYWLLYAVVYVPSLFLSHYLHRQSDLDLYLLNISLFLSFYILGLPYKLPLQAITSPKLSNKTWWFFIAVTGGFLYITVMVVYGGRLQFAGLYNTELRLASRDINTTFVTGYGQAWLVNVINPMLMAIGLHRKNPLLFIIGATGQVLLFMTVAMKGWLLSIFLLPFMFLVLKSKNNILGLRFIIGMSGLLIIPIICMFYTSPLSVSIQDLIGFRLFSDAGFMTSVYSDYFSNNPWTYWSHLKGISALVQYPYDLTLNYLIGEYLGNSLNSANAHAWAMDGIAAMGVIGTLVVGILMGIIFYILDCSSAGLNPKLSGLSIVMHGIALGNLSLMSSCLGGGILFNIILFWLMPRHIISPELISCKKLLQLGHEKRQCYLHNDRFIKGERLSGGLI
jgi:hypothetical protein